jgi:uncharacterized Ntn-hydrolase superfamily protein
LPLCARRRRCGCHAIDHQSLLGPAILDLIARGIAPAAAIDSALAADEGRQLRQVHVVDRLGRAAAWTGRHCVDTCGDRTTAHVWVAGNMLGGEAVIAETFDAFAAGSDLPLPERLLAALQAGERAGGDRRGKQSAALLLTTTEDFADLNVRVDDHPEPLSELGRLLAIWRQQWPGRAAWAPSKANPSGCTDLDTIEAAWQAQGLDLRFRR